MMWKILRRFAAPVPTFFIAGLLYLLRFERIDNLAAHSIPSEIGLPVPSDSDSLELHYRRFLVSIAVRLSLAHNRLPRGKIPPKVVRVLYAKHQCCDV
jgi:hypothetical protein